MLGVRFEPKTIEEIESRAESEEISKSEFVRQAVAHELGETLPKDRIDLLETAVKHLLDQTAPNDDLTRLNSKNHELLEEFRDQEE